MKTSPGVLITYQETPIRLSLGFLVEILQTWRKGGGEKKKKENYTWQRSFKNEEKWTFPDKHKHRKFITMRTVLQETLKGVPQIKMKDTN